MLSFKDSIECSKRKRGRPKKTVKKKNKSEEEKKEVEISDEIRPKRKINLPSR